MGGIVEFIIRAKDGLSSPLAKITTTSSSAKGALGQLTQNNKQFQTSVDNSGKSVQNLSKHLRDLKDTATGNWLQPLGNASSILAGGMLIAGAGIAGMLNKGMQQSKESLDFRMLLGDKAGKQLYSGLKDLTPVLGEGVKSAAKDLLGVGIATEKLTPLLTQLGAVSRGDEGRFGGLSSSFVQLQKDGKLTESTLAAMNDAGFKPLTHISEKFGIKFSQVQQMLADGKISIDMVNDALAAATGKGGEYADVMDRLNGEPSTLWNKLTTKVSGYAGALGEVLLPVALKTLTVFEGLFDWGKKNETLLKTLTGVVVGAAIGYYAFQTYQRLSYIWMMRETIATTALAGAKGILAVATGGLSVATGALNAVFLASPIGWVVGGIGLLVGGVILAWNKFEGFRKFLYTLYGSVKEVFSNIGTIIKTTLKGAGKTLLGVLTLNPAMMMSGLEDLKTGFTLTVDSAKKGAQKGALMHVANEENRKKKSATEEHFGTGEESVMQKLLAVRELPTADAKTEAGLNAVSGGGERNITITIGKMVEKLEIKVVGGTAQVAQDLERMIEEVMVRAVASGARRGVN